MSDKDKLAELLGEFGIAFKDDGKVVTCKDGLDKKDDYGIFFTAFEFDDEGNFIKMDVRE